MIVRILVVALLAIPALGAAILVVLATVVAFAVQLALQLVRQDRISDAWREASRPFRRAA